MTTKKPKKISAPSAPICEEASGEHEFIGDLRVVHVLNLDKTQSMDDPAVKSKVVTGRSNIIEVEPGACLVLEAGTGPAKEYLVTQTQHIGIFPKASSSGLASAAKEGYSNTFECVPFGVPYRREAKVNHPKIYDTVPATVVAPDADCRKPIPIPASASASDSTGRGKRSIRTRGARAGRVSCTPSAGC